jgi:hypothetical protein
MNLVRLVLASLDSGQKYVTALNYRGHGSIAVILPASVKRFATSMLADYGFTQGWNCHRFNLLDFC